MRRADHTGSASAAVCAVESMSVRGMDQQHEDEAQMQALRRQQTGPPDEWVPRFKSRPKARYLSESSRARQSEDARSRMKLWQSVAWRQLEADRKARVESNRLLYELATLVAELISPTMGTKRAMRKAHAIEQSLPR